MHRTGTGESQRGNPTGQGVFEKHSITPNVRGTDPLKARSYYTPFRFGEREQNHLTAPRIGKDVKNGILFLCWRGQIRAHPLRSDQQYRISKLWLPVCLSQLPASESGLAEPPITPRHCQKKRSPGPSLGAAGDRPGHSTFNRLSQVRRVTQQAWGKCSERKPSPSAHGGTPTTRQSDLQS